METPLHPLSSEAMYEKHQATVAEQHALLNKKKKKRRNKKKKQNDGEVCLIDVYVLTYEWPPTATPLPSPSHR